MSNDTNIFFYSRKEALVTELCEEIDQLMQDRNYYKKLYEEEKKLRNEEFNRSFEDAKKGIANALQFALSIKDAEDGSLVISKEDRNELAQLYKTKKMP